MSLKNQLSFASGEIDPILHDRVTLDRFQNGLATARNVMIGKTGSIMSRFSRTHFKEVHHDGPIKIFCPPDVEMLIEFGVNSVDDKFYVRVYNWSSTTEIYEFIEATAGVTGITADNLEDLQFTTIGGGTITITMGSNSSSIILQMGYVSPFIIFTPGAFTAPLPSVDLFVISGSGSGYTVDYAVTYVKKGEESLSLAVTTGAILRPISIAEKMDCVATITGAATFIDDYNEMRIYRRPREGGAFGLIGTTTQLYVSGSDIKADFSDVGGNADFNNGIPSPVINDGLSGIENIGELIIGTATIYQGRLMLGNFIDTFDKEAIVASRPGIKTNFYRDFPYDSDSALLFKAGGEGEAVILRMIEADGLVVFTSKGVFVSLGILGPSNLALIKRGGWIIDEAIPPLFIPGALLFVDKTTNTIRQLVYSQELGGYDSIDQSVFSDHLFKSKTIKTWAFQQGAVPILIVTFLDGSFATFTYNFEHKMRAWTRHDSSLPVEQVTSTDTADTSFFVVNNDGTRSIERTVPRRILPTVSENNPDADKFEYGAFMDSIINSHDLLNDSLTGSDVLTLTPVLAGVWDGELTLNSGTSGIFATYGSAGEIYKVFNLTDNSEIDLIFVSKTDNDNIVVQPSEDFPSAQAAISRIYLIQETITGLTHLEGESVSVMVDGNVIASPNNDNQNESVLTLTVASGEIDIPSDLAGAITIVGRPITADVQTLNVSTVEQSPTIVESLTVNKLYVRVFESRGGFVDNLFPEEKTGGKDGNSVADMQSLDKYYQQSGVAIIANRYKQPISRRVELTVPGSWDSQGKMSIRQVDPLHFEILSIIPDLEVERRR